MIFVLRLSETVNQIFLSERRATHMELYKAMAVLVRLYGCGKWVADNLS